MSDALVFADHHAGGGYPQRGIDDSHHALSQVLDLARSHKVEWVIALGDTLDQQRNRARAVVPLKNQLRGLKADGIRFGYLRGNHDFDDPPWLDDPDCFHLDRVELELGGRLWYGLDFRPGVDILSLLRDQVPPGVSGLLMHQCWADLMGPVAAPQCEFADVPAQVKYLLTGDYHGGFVLDKVRGRGGQPLLVCNPGSTSVQDITEPGEKFVVLVGGGRKMFRKLPLVSRPLLRSDLLHTAGDLDRFLAAVGVLVDDAAGAASVRGLPRELCRPLLQVRVSYSLADAVRRVEKAVGDRAHLFFKELHEDRAAPTPYRGCEEFQEGVVTPADLLQAALDPDGTGSALHDEALPLAQALLAQKDADGVRRVLADWRVERARAEGE